MELLGGTEALVDLVRGSEQPDGALGTGTQAGPARIRTAAATPFNLVFEARP